MSSGTNITPPWYTSGVTAVIICKSASDAARMAELMSESAVLGSQLPTQVMGNSYEADIYWTSTPWPGGTYPVPGPPPASAKVFAAIQATGVQYTGYIYSTNVEGGPW